MMKALFALFFVAMLAAGCAKSTCPNNYSNISGSATPSQSKTNAASGPAKSAGTTNAKSGRFVKRNAYHPSRQTSAQ